ncbi:MAG: 2-iminoacetate synthase ThiH, partial [Selenomonadales bacterium]|nr:2-iminoacetate synthase ThiH [Selenomonadales bacterium]
MMQRCMTYLPDMQEIDSDILPRVNEARDAYCADDYTADDVKAALRRERLTVRDYGALLSPAAEPFLEEMA